MKKILKISVFIFLLSCTTGEMNYEAFKSMQDPSVPLFTDSASNKVALFVFPHPDDEVGCGGTIWQLKRQGWKINLLTLTKGNTLEKNQREAEWKNAQREFGFDESELLDLPNNPWDSIMNDHLDFWYDQADSVAKLIYQSICKYKPSVIFPYDTALGAYGHPEHRITAQMTRRVFLTHVNDSAFSVKRVFQITLPEKMEQAMLSESQSYLNAKVRTGNKTLPDPTVSFDIRLGWPLKRRAAAQYTSQIKTLKKFYLLPDEEDTTMHYDAFNREYYAEIKKKDK